MAPTPRGLPPLENAAKVLPLGVAAVPAVAAAASESKAGDDDGAAAAGAAPADGAAADESAAPAGAMGRLSLAVFGPKRPNRLRTSTFGKMSRVLVPKSAGNYASRLRALLKEDESQREAGDGDAEWLSISVLVDCLRRMKYDAGLFAGYGNLVVYLLYVFIFLVVIWLQRSIGGNGRGEVLSVMDRLYEDANATRVFPKSVYPIRERLSGFDGFYGFLKNNVVDLIFSEAACGDGAFAEHGLGGYTAAQWGAQDEYGAVVQAPVAGWNVCHESDARLGSFETVCVWDGDVTIGGLPYRTAELDPKHVDFGGSVSLELYAGNWELRFAFDGFDATHPETGATVAVAHPAVRGSLCRGDACETWAPCPNASACDCSFVDNEYVCLGDAFWEAYDADAMKPGLAGLEDLDRELAAYGDSLALEAIADWWQVPRPFDEDDSYWGGRESPRAALDGDWDDACAYHTVVALDPYNAYTWGNDAIEIWTADAATAADADQATLAAAKRTLVATITCAADCEEHRVLLCANKAYVFTARDNGDSASTRSGGELAYEVYADGSVDPVFRGNAKWSYGVPAGGCPDGAYAYGDANGLLGWYNWGSFCIDPANSHCLLLAATRGTYCDPSLEGSSGLDFRPSGQAPDAATWSGALCPPTGGTCAGFRGLRRRLDALRLRRQPAAAAGARGGRRGSRRPATEAAAADGRAATAAAPAIAAGAEPAGGPPAETKRRLASASAAMDCAFDSDLCAWTTPTESDLPWAWNSGKTGTQDTGPKDRADWTDAADGYAYYMAEYAPLIDCVGCAGDLCNVRGGQDPAWYGNVFGAPAQALRSAGDVYVAANGYTVNAATVAAETCDAQLVGDGYCDVEQNTLACDYDGGDCCGEDPGCSAPWFRDPEDGRLYDAVADKLFLEFAGDGLVGNLDEDEAPRALANHSDGAALLAGFDAARDALMPSLACPECASYAGAYRSVPFALNVTDANRVRGGSAQGSTRERDSQLQRLLSRPFSTRSAYDMFPGLAADDVRIRYFNKPNMAVVGPKLTQRRVKAADCPSAGPFASEESRAVLKDKAYYTMARPGRAGGEDYAVVFDINLNRTRAEEMLKTLIYGGYFDGHTVEVALEILLMNRESERLTWLAFRLERQEAGGFSLSREVSFIDPMPYDQADDYARLVFELLFVIMFVVNVVFEFDEMRGVYRSTGSLGDYLTVFNLVDWAAFTVRFAMIVVWCVIVARCESFESALRFDVFADDVAVGRITEASAALADAQRTYADVGRLKQLYVIYERLNVYSIIVMSNNFATVSHSTVTMLSALAGLYSHPSDDDSASQLFYWSYMLVSFFVMLNALLAIIIDAYTAVVAEIGSAPPDPLIFAFWSRVDGNGTAAGDHAVPLDDVMPLLEAWVGPELARVEATGGDGLFARPRGSLRTEDELDNREEHKRTLHADRARGDAFRAMYAELAATAPAAEVRPTELSLTWKPDPMSPAICIDFHLLCLVIAVYEAYHRRANPHADLPAIGDHEIRVVAINVLARYGATSDLDNDGLVEDHEQKALVKLLQLYPFLTRYGVCVGVDDAAHARNRRMFKLAINFLSGLTSTEALAAEAHAIIHDGEANPPPAETMDQVIDGLVDDPDGRRWHVWDSRASLGL
ncbi:hypothetical protein JL721_1467 [Aureococcus anophagefferens]|nr:hypothetical protein JL721_1467 [Aureococcus anophagefferens]